jgi:enoyl-CoA hydratase/carnithine racemase
MAIVDHYIDSLVGVITFNNSEKGNVLNIESMEELLAAVSSLMEDKEVRAILLRSNGTNFCLGMDLNMLVASRGSRGLAEKAVSLYVRLLSRIFSGPKPVISLVNGSVKAGGIGLVAASDIVVASDSSTFELSEIFFGLIPANVLPFIYSVRLPPQKARYLILTGKRLSAKEAERINLVDDVFIPEELEKGVKAILKNLLRASPEAMKETKRFTEVLFSERRERAQDLAKAQLLKMIKDKEVIQAVNDFNEGALPSWFAKFKPERPLV